MDHQHDNTYHAALKNGFVTPVKKSKTIKLKGSNNLVLTYNLESRQLEFSPAKDPIDSLQKWTIVPRTGMWEIARHDTYLTKKKLQISRYNFFRFRQVFLERVQLEKSSSQTL